MSGTGPYLLLTEEEYKRGYHGWIGRTQKHYEYELVQAFLDAKIQLRTIGGGISIHKVDLYLVIDPQAQTAPREISVEGKFT